MEKTPPARVKVWLKLPAFCRKATCPPCGAGGLPEVKPLLLPETPACPTKAHGDAGGECHLLAEAAGVLQERDLAPLRGAGVARREAAAVAGDARLPGERPRRRRRVVHVRRRAGADRRRLEPGILQLRGRLRGGSE